jgi:hypothetical protein
MDIYLAVPREGEHSKCIIRHEHTTEALSFSVGNVLFSFWISILLCHSKIDHVNLHRMSLGL